MTGDVVPEGYGDLLAQVKEQVRGARARVQRVVNTELLLLYWDIGQAILQRQSVQGWGGRVVDRLSDDLRREFPDMKGLGRANLHSMRRFAATWSRDEVVQQAVGQLPWGHIVELMNRAPDRSVQDWYAEQAVVNLWSRAVLLHQLATDLHGRHGAAPTNFDHRLDPANAQHSW